MLSQPSTQPCQRNLVKEVELKIDGRFYLHTVKGEGAGVRCNSNDGWTREMRVGEVIPKEHLGDYLYLIHNVYPARYIVCCQNHKDLFLNVGWKII